MAHSFYRESQRVYSLYIATLIDFISGAQGGSDAGFKCRMSDCQMNEHQPFVNDCMHATFADNDVAHPSGSLRFGCSQRTAYVN